MTTITKEFKIPCKPEVVKQVDSEGNEGFIITGVANTGLEDLVGDVVTQEALQSIAEQIPTHNLHLDHDKDFTGILGPLLDGWVDEAGYLHYNARIVDERSSLIKSYLEQGVNFGSSIAGVCEYEEDSFSTIVNWALTEISLTGTPCDQGTMGTVQIAKSLRAVLDEIKETKTNGGNTMSTEPNEQTDMTEERVIELINEAFNEKEEDLEARFNELLEKINDLEAKIDDQEGEEGGEGEEGTPAPEGSESPEGEKKEDEEDEEGEEEEEEEEGKGIDTEEVKSLIQKTVEDAVQSQLRKTFSQNQPSFTYDNQEKGVKPGEDTENKKYTAEEIADILAGG